MEAKITEPEEFRRRIRELLNEKTEGVFTPKEITFMEFSIFNASLKLADKNNVVKLWDNNEFVFLYTNRLRSVLDNLTPKNIARLQAKELIFREVGELTHMQWNPENWASIIAEKEKQDNYKEVFATTNTFVCRACKGRECMYREFQTRSADEGSTLFVVCCNPRCGYKFVLNN